MKRKIILRALIGAPIGVFISTFITIIISLTVGDNRYYPIVPQLAEICGNEITAVTVQFITCMIYGAVWGGMSLIWQFEKWSILRQTAVHFIICTLTTFPIAYFMLWMEHSIKGVLIYFSAFIAVYAAIWLCVTLSVKNKIKNINRKIQD